MDLHSKVSKVSNVCLGWSVLVVVKFVMGSQVQQAMMLMLMLMLMIGVALLELGLELLEQELELLVVEVDGVALQEATDPEMVGQEDRRCHPTLLVVLLGSCSSWGPSSIPLFFLFWKLVQTC